MSTPNSMYHIPGLENQPDSQLHCGAPIPGGGACFGIMSLKTCLDSQAPKDSKYYSATRETWECNHCHNRQYIWVYAAVGGDPKDDSNPSTPERASCVMCRNDYPRTLLDENLMCEACAVWYKLAPVS